MWHEPPQNVCPGCTPFLQVYIICSRARPRGFSIHYTRVPEISLTKTECLRTIVPGVRLGSGGQVLIVRLENVGSVTHHEGGTRNPNPQHEDASINTRG